MVPEEACCEEDDICSEVVHRQVSPTRQISPVSVVPAAWTGDSRRDDLKLYSVHWGRSLLASAVSAGYIFSGLWLIGLSEGGSLRGHSQLVTLLRLLGWCLMFLCPLTLCLSNLMCCMLYGAVTEHSSLRELFLPVFCTSGMAKHRAAVGARKARQAAIMMAVVNGVPFIATTALVMFPLPAPHDHFGILVVGLLGGMVCRIPIFLTAERVVQTAPRPVFRYFLSMLRVQIFAIVGFFASCTLLGRLILPAGPSYAWLVTPWLGAYELAGMLLVRKQFIQAYIRNPDARRHLVDTPQAVIPSLLLAAFHSNAEAARAVVLLTTADHTRTVLPVISSLLATMVWNTLLRTGWGVQLVGIACCRKITDSNALRLLFRAKFQMGYPRFFAVAAVGLARLILGRAPAPSPSVALAALLLVGAEIAEDGAVLLASRLGLSQKLPEPSKPACHAGPRVPAARGGAAFKCCFTRRRVLPEAGSVCEGGHAIGKASSTEAPPLEPVERSQIAEFEAAASWAQMLDEHAFLYEKGNGFQDMPLWATFIPIFLSQVGVVIFLFCLQGVPYVFDLCNQSASSILESGLLWWPIVDYRDCRDMLDFLGSK